MATPSPTTQCLNCVDKCRGQLVARGSGDPMKQQRYAKISADKLMFRFYLTWHLCVNVDISRCATHAHVPSKSRTLFWCSAPLAVAKIQQTDNPSMLPFQHGCHQVSSSFNCTSPRIFPDFSPMKLTISPISMGCQHRGLDVLRNGFAVRPSLVVVETPRRNAGVEWR